MLQYQHRRLSQDYGETDITQESLGHSYYAVCKEYRLLIVESLKTRSIIEYLFCYSCVLP